jgi:predicted Zn-dependent peptidase
MIKMDYQKTVLNNGITVITEEMNSVRSVSIGIWVKIGGRFERISEHGLAHFLEHMIFKGTRKRTPLQIVRGIESLGGNINAFTSKELTCYFASTLDIHLNKTIQILADIICNSTFPEKEINKEKMVIMEEINSVKDTPEEYIFDIFQEKLFPDNPLGRSILGNEKTVPRFRRSKIIDFWQKHYISDKIIISAAGKLNHNRLIKVIDKYFVNQNHIDKDKLPKTKKNNISKSKTFIIDMPINQAHLCIGSDSVSYTANEKIPLLILNAYLGDGMSSRLFQLMREKLGFAYSVYSFTDFFSDTGIFGVYIGMDVKKIDAVLRILRKEFLSLLKHPIQQSTLNRIKNRLKGNIVLGMESTSHRMSRMAKNEIYYGRFIPIDSLLSSIDAITVDDVLSIAQKIIRPDDFINVIFHPSN